MLKTIPTTFDIVLLDAEPTPVAESLPNAKRVNVGVFYKHGNRNGSYITDEMAQHFIDNCQGIPLVGFYDSDTSSWAGHTGPSLAHGYGYVESFIGWTPQVDTDGVIREYATFSVVTFSDYFEEVQSIRGLNQSMELDPKTVDGEWAEIDGQEYFIYSKANMYALCIIGSHEPCFSASTFFSKHTEELGEMSALIFELRQQIEQLNNKGGEYMEEQNMTTAAETLEEECVVENFEETESSIEETEETTAAIEEEVATENFEESVEEAVTEETIDFEQAYNDIKAQLEELQNELENMKKKSCAELAERDELICSYQEKERVAEQARKQSLLNKYEKVLTREEIDEIGQTINDFSYDDIESRLAVLYSRKTMKIEDATTFVPQVNFETNDMYAFMAKYKKKTK